jgi:hypothetical protein
MADAMTKGKGRGAWGRRQAARYAAPLLLGLASAAWCGMTDPTRPPPGFGAAGGSAAMAPPLVVSSVFLMGAHPYAQVDGMTVRPGDRLGDGRVSRIDAQGVWLRSRAGERLLRLVPGIDKTPAEPGRTRMEKTQ